MFGRLDSTVQDVIYGLRTLTRNRGFALAAILMLGVGLSANTAVFSVVHAVLLRPLPYEAPDRVVLVFEDASFASFPKDTPAPANYFDWKRMNRVFTDLAATSPVSANLSVDGPPEQVLGRAVTANFFSVLGVQPVVGRAFTAEEDATGAPVVVISQGLWQRRYEGDRQIVGRTLVLSGQVQTVIGVMPSDFMYESRDVDYWTPMHFTPADTTERASHYLSVVARLRPGVSIEQARDNMSTIGRQLEKDYPDTNAHRGVVVVAIADQVVGNSRLLLLVLMGAAGCVLLILCANLAGLLLARAMNRRGEVALRLALGASALRLVRQMVAEGVILALAGGIIGLALTPMGTVLLERLVPATVPPMERSLLSVPLLTFALAASLLTGILCSIVPAISAIRGPVNATLQQQSGRATGGRNRLAQDALVVFQVSIALVLLVSAGLMLRTMRNLQAIDFGFRPDQLQTMRTNLPVERYRDPANRTGFYERVLERVQQVPGVQSAAYASTLPFTSRGTTRVYRVDDSRAVLDSQDALYRVATNGYLDVLGVQLLEGRLLTRSDTATTPKAVIINETLARRHWPHGGALGHRLRFGRDDTVPEYTIVGVIKDVRERGHLLETKPGVYLPSAQEQESWLTFLIVRMAPNVPEAVSAIRRIVAEVDPAQPVSAVRTMNEILARDVADRQLQLTLLSLFAALSLTLAVVGLYAVQSYAVIRRTREISLRIALGAPVAAVFRLIVTHALILTGTGLVIGVAVAVLLTRAMKSLLYGVDALDPATYAGVAAVLCLVALTACSVPALRAARMDPMKALRQS